MNETNIFYNFVNEFRYCYYAKKIEFFSFIFLLHREKLYSIRIKFLAEKLSVKHALNKKGLFSTKCTCLCL